MNRDVGRGTDTLQQAQSSSYLIYLFVISAAAVVLLPYLPSFGGIIFRLGKKGSISKGQTSKASASPYTYPSLSPNFIVPRDQISEERHENLEMVVIDLQRTIHIERERVRQLENELRVLYLSGRFLSERMQKLEERDLDHRRSFSMGSAPTELLMQRTTNVLSKQGDLVAQVQELSRMLQDEKERNNELALEIKLLRMSESSLVDRITTLEEKFNAFLLKDRQNRHIGSKYEQNDFV